MIRTDWTSDNVVFVDFETVSLCDLREEGGRAYAAHLSTRVLCCSFVGDECKHLWVPDWVHLEMPVAVRDFVVTRDLASVPLCSDDVLCGHNAMEFDALVWERFCGTNHAWRDTMPLCRAMALPGGLDAACDRLFALRKNPKGKVLDVLSRAYVRGGRVEYPIGTVGAWEMLLEYCADDCLLLQRLHDAVIGAAEPDVLRVDAAVNGRGFPVDTALAARLIVLQDELARARRVEVEEVTDGDLSAMDVTSVARVKAWLVANGVTLPTRNGKPSMVRVDLQRLFEDPSEFCGDEVSTQLVQKVLRLRQQIARNTAAKAVRMLRVAGDGRARGQHAYHSAHTGRWGGRQVQPHNFPVGVDVDHALARHDLTLDDVCVEAERLKSTPADVLATLLRPCVAGDKPLAIADYGQVEARGVCWVSGEAGALQFFADPSRDYYRNYVAPLIYGRSAVIGERERYFAKQTGLGCGFSMSGRKLRAHMVANGVDFVAAGVSPEGIVKAYRDGHPRVVAGWKVANDALFAAMRGEEAVALRCVFYRDGGSLVVRLPSGRNLYYRDAALEMQIPPWAALYGASAEPRETVAYTHPRGWRGSLFGGRICENIVQAVCRDLLAEAMVRAEDAGMQPVMHIHDEIVCFASNTLIMTHRGNIPIVEVTSDDFVWDGVEWVRTSGAIFNGTKEVGEWMGISVTAKHMIFDGTKWRRVSELDGESTKKSVDWSSQTIDSERNGGVHTPRCIYGVTIQTTCSTRGMGRAEFESMSYGSTTGSVSSNSSSHFPVGMSRVSNSIAPTMIKDTFQTTFGWRQAQKTRAIDTIQQSSNSLESRCISSSFIDDSVQPGMCGQLDADLRADNPLSALWTTTGRCVPVYDLVNCGPRHAYTVITPHGPVLAHNCENATADELAELMSKAPLWAAGFPVLVEAFTSARYWKKPDKGVAAVRYLNGRRV